MFTNAASAGVRVKVNGIQSGCLGDCSYKFITPASGIVNEDDIQGPSRLLQSTEFIPAVTSASLSDLTLTFRMTNNGTFKLGDLNIMLDVEKCTVIEDKTTVIDSDTDYTCELKTKMQTT